MFISAFKNKLKLDAIRKQVELKLMKLKLRKQSTKTNLLLYKALTNNKLTATYIIHNGLNCIYITYKQ